MRKFGKYIQQMGTVFRDYGASMPAFLIALSRAIINLFLRDARRDSFEKFDWSNVSKNLILTRILSTYLVSDFNHEIQMIKIPDTHYLDINS
jgi:hypothetical protein